MSKNWVQLVYSKDDDALFLRLNTAKRNICIGIDKWGNKEIFPISHIPNDFQSPSSLGYRGTNPLSISNSGALGLLQAVNFKETGGLFQRVTDEPDVRTAHQLMHAAGIKIGDGEYNPYLQSGWGAKYHYSEKKISYDENPRIAILQQYQHYPRTIVEKPTNITEKDVDLEVLNLIKRATQNGAVDKQLDKVMSSQPENHPTNTQHNHAPNQYLINQILKEITEQKSHGEDIPNQLLSQKMR